MINLITSILMISAIGLSVPQNKVHYDYYDNDNYEYIEVEKPKEKLVSYDDEGYGITLSADELNNYTFENLINLSSSVLQFSITYQEHSFSYYQYNGATPYVIYEYSGQSLYISLNYNGDYKFVVGSTPFANDGFISSIIINSNSTNYANVKQAIEADISANSSPNYQNILVESLELLTGGLTTIAAALGSGMAAYVEGLLISGTSMSAFASVIFLFCGIALAFALGRWVVNFIGSLGKRNR